MNKEVVVFLKTIAPVIIGLLVIDLLVGWAGDKALKSIPAKDYSFSRANTAFYSVEADVIIIGSSRAVHHYNSLLMEELMDTSVYNTGMDGQGFYYNSCILHRILERKVPRMVIFETLESLFDGRFESSNALIPYYHQDEYTRESIDEVYGKTMPIKMLSNLYRFNDVPIKVVSSLIAGEDTKGFSPLPPQDRQTDVIISGQQEIIIDQDVYNRFLEILNWSKEYGFKMVVVDSPRLEFNEGTNKRLEAICNSENIRFIDNSRLYTERPDFFNDATHLNSIGADAYTEYFVKQIELELK